MLIRSGLLFLFGEARLANLAQPVNHFYDFSNNAVNSSEYKFVIFTDPQMGKYDRDHGVGVSSQFIDWKVELLF